MKRTFAPAPVLSRYRSGGVPPKAVAFTQQAAAKVQTDPGHSLSPAVRGPFEKAFGHDFSQVRVHHGPAPNTWAQGLGASAFTFGRDIAFGAGHFQPGSPQGARRLAHELAHVVQQSGATSTATGRVSAHDPRETDADRAAEHALAGRPVGPLMASPVVLACDDLDSEPEPAVTAAPEPADVHAGKMVRRIIIDLNRGRVGFEVGNEMIRGSVSTDLKPGKYNVEPDFTEHDWVFRTGDEGEAPDATPRPSVKEGQRFQVELEGALPSTLSYPDKIPLVVGISTDSATPQNDADMVRFFDELEIEKRQEIDDPTIDGFIDMEYTPTWQSDGKQGHYSSKVTLVFLDGSREVIDLGEIDSGTMNDDARVKAIVEATTMSNGRLRPTVLNASTAPNLVAMKAQVRARQKWLEARGESESLAMQLNTFPLVFSLLTINPLTMASPISSGRSLGRSPLPRTPLIGRGGGKNMTPPAPGADTAPVAAALKPPTAAEYAAIRGPDTAASLKAANRIMENPATVYNHEVRQGGLGSIAESQELLAGGGTSAFGGGAAARAHFGPAKHVDRYPVVEFRTAVKGSARPFLEGVGANWTSGLKNSPIDQSLKIEILRIRFPDGRIATPLTGGRFQVRSPNGDISVVDAIKLGD